MISSVIRTCFPAAAKVVADKAEDINKLNVFPVPDGDTGTNMSLTLGTVVKDGPGPARRRLRGGHRARQSPHGALMGARGNSGVITSPDPARPVPRGCATAKNQEDADSR